MQQLWLAALILLLATAPVRAQAPKATSAPKAAAVSDTTVYTFAEQMPQPPGGGGNAAINALIAKGLRFPPVSLNEQVPGSRVVVEFTVTKTGNISNVRGLKSFSRSIDNEVMRAVKALPRLTPGRQQGVPVNVRIMIPVTICLR